MKYGFFLTAALLGLTGCSSLQEQTAEYLSGKNTTLDGYVFYGSGETVNPETASPRAKVMIGRMSFKSRNVSVPETAKIPNTGYFKSTRAKSVFGTEEEIIEYDFTASDPAAVLEFQRGLSSALTPAEH